MRVPSTPRPYLIQSISINFVDVAIARRGYYQGLDEEQNRSCKIWIWKIQLVDYTWQGMIAKKKGQGLRRGAYISNKSDLVKGRLRV